jgi:hypothetical protein
VCDSSAETAARLVGRTVLASASAMISKINGASSVEEVVGSGVVGCSVAGPGSDFSVALMPGFESTALEFVAAPECPPGPVLPAAAVPAWAGWKASLSMVPRRPVRADGPPRCRCWPRTARATGRGRLAGAAPPA